MIADDMANRISVTPAVDYSFAMVEKTSDMQCQIRFDASGLGNLEVKISGQPTVDKAPRLARDLEYRLVKTDEPKFAIACQEHPEVRYGSSSVIPPGLKHFTISFTEPVRPGAAADRLKTLYHAQNITWEDERKVNFTADLKLGDRLAVLPPVSTDARGVPFNWASIDGGYIWCGQNTPLLTVSGPNQVVEGNLISSLTMDAALSPKGDFTVIAEEVPNPDEEASVANISIMNLASGQTTPIFKKTITIGPCFGTLWQPTGERLWVVEGLGTWVGTESRKVRLLDPYHGEAVKIPLSLSEDEYVLGAAVSPVDGSLVVAIAGEPGANRLLPFRLEIYAPNGEFDRRLAVGWVPLSSMHTKYMLVRADGRTVQIQLRSGFVVSEAGGAQLGTAVIDLVTGEIKMISVPSTARFSPLGTYYVSANAQKSQMVYRSDGESIGDLGVLSPAVYWSSDEKRIAYLDESRHLMVFDTATRQSVKWLDRPVMQILGWTPNGVLVTEAEPR